MIELVMPAKRPLLGILVEPEAASVFPNVPPLSNFALQMEAAEKAGVTAYYFTLQDINPADMAVSGWVHEDTG